MDAALLDWTAIGLGLSAPLLLVWGHQAWRAKASPVALLAGLAHWGVAALHMAAPAEALLNPHYPGYAFGFLQADGGWAAMALSSAVLLLALVGAFNALGQGRRAQLRVGATSLLFLVNLGGAALAAAMLGRDGDRLFQIGDALAAPSAGWLALAGALFFLSAVWAGRRALPLSA
jgi:hypothetical protein